MGSNGLSRLSLVDPDVLRLSHFGAHFVDILKALFHSVFAP